MLPLINVVNPLYDIYTYYAVRCTPYFGWVGGWVFGWVSFSGGWDIHILYSGENAETITKWLCCRVHPRNTYYAGRQASCSFTAAVA